MTTFTVGLPLTTLRRKEQNHRQLIALVSLIMTLSFIALTLFGLSYYRLDKVDRGFSPKHHLLRPSGVIGISLAFIGVVMLCGIFLYPLRKRWRWLQRHGQNRQLAAGGHPGQ